MQSHFTAWRVRKSSCTWQLVLAVVGSVLPNDKKQFFEQQDSGQLERPAKKQKNQGFVCKPQVGANKQNKTSESEYHKLAPWKKTLPQKMATMFLFELAEHLWLYSGDHVRSSGTREGKKTKVAQVASSARSMQSLTFFSYFGLECVRLWTMGNFSLEL